MMVLTTLEWAPLRLEWLPSGDKMDTVPVLAFGTIGSYFSLAGALTPNNCRPILARQEPLLKSKGLS
jgi:hypothetical protein